ncbi:unnamed protein product [Trichobilharzia regenti]|nr:unnamed protein product [Trichobilharzia regenti]
MRLTGILYGKRIRHDKLQFLTNRYWRKVGSKLSVDCLRVPEQILNDSNSPIKEAENMFRSTRYDDDLLKEIEIGITSDEAYEIEQQRAKKLQSFNPLYDDPRFHQNSESSLVFSQKRRFSKGVDQASLLTNVRFFYGFLFLLY